LKVLISPNEALLNKTLLRWGHEVTIVSNGDEALHQLQQQDPPDLAILNSGMEGLRGVELCERLRGNEIERYIYLILLMEKSPQDDLLEAFENGADDYLLKPFDGYELRAKLIVAKRILALQDRLFAMRDELLVQATHDSLTGIWNRRASMEALARELSRASREKKSVGLMLADLDHFKQINDTYGHPAGDHVLQAVAGKLTTALRSYDTVGRYGGEEFLIVSPGCEETALARRAESVRASIASEPVVTHEAVIPVSLSIGIAVASAAVTPDRLLKSADEALYRAKRAGRNRVEVAEELRGVI